MDIFLGKVTQQAMNYAIRSGITITAGYAIKQSARLLKTVEGNEREELQDLQERLDSKIRIISPAIDMIELISARGNTSLESAVTLTKALRWEIQSLGQRLATAATAEENIRRRSPRAQDKAEHVRELQSITKAIRRLLNRIEDAVPLINLAITASGASLSSSLPSTVSPSRLLQASTFLTAGDSQYYTSSSGPVQIGPTFMLSMYMLFQGHLRPQNEEDVRESTWKEVIHKANVKLMRVPIDALYAMPETQSPGLASSPNGYNNTSTISREENGDRKSPSRIEAEVRADEYAYQMVIIEDLEDDRVHTFEDDEPQPAPYGDVALAGIREAVPIHELSKIFYADTGKILNIGSEGETNSPVLLLKRDPNAIPPRRMMDRYSGDDSNGYENDNTKVVESPSSAGDNKALASSSDVQFARTADPWRLPQDLDPEWLAFEVYTETHDSDTESEIDTPSSKPSRPSRVPSQEPSTLSHLHLNDDNNNNAPTTPSPSRLPLPPTPTNQHHLSPKTPNHLPPIRTSLSLLETLLRLLSLQQFQQSPHLSIPDELLTFFLSESASTGAASNDIQERKRLREEARRRVGFDPYDESPVKWRGEEYLDQYGVRHSHHQGGDEEEGGGYESPGRFRTSRYEHEGYDTRNGTDGLGSRGGTPVTPVMLRRGLRERGTGGTPEGGGGGGRRPPPLRGWSEGVAAKGRRGSPLARPGTGVTDEGLGTSPASMKGGGKKV